MEILVIDFDRPFANILGGTLASFGCQTEIASGPLPALRLLRERHFDSILIDSYLPVVASRAILREIYSQLPTVVRLMTSVPASTMQVETRYEEGMEFISATAGAILSIVRSTHDNEVALIVGSAVPVELRRTLLGEGYPAPVTRDLDRATRLLFSATHPIIFLEAEVPGLTTANQLAVLHKLTAKSLAVLANARPVSNLRCIPKPNSNPDVIKLLSNLREDVNALEPGKVAAL